MDKSKSKEKVKYIDKLDKEPRDRYIAKLSYVSGFDPYDKDSAASWTFTLDVNKLPSLTFGDILTYLVFGVSAYTLEQFRSFKSLEAHSQFTNGWVHDLNIFSPEGSDNTLVKAKVLHSMRLNEKPLLPWVILDNSGKVVTAHCDCMAGLAETCTHVGAILFKIEAVIRIREKPTVTGVPAYWVIPSAVNKVESEVGYKIDFTSSAAKKKQLDQVIDGTEAQLPGLRTSISSNTDAPSLSSLEFNAFIAAMHGTGDKPSLLSGVPGYAKFYEDPVKPILIPRSLRSLKNEKYNAVTKEQLFEYCCNLFDDPCIHVSQEEADKIEMQTKAQHNSPAWFAARAGRITASQLYHVCSFKDERPAMSTIKSVCYPGKQKMTTPAIQWGCSHEQQAVDTYFQRHKSTHCKLRVEKSGFIINCDVPYMGGSPDAIINCECCGKGTLEVKCPYKHRDSTIVNACNDSNFCMSYSNGQFALKTEHRYYYQAQCQLMVSKANYCDFAVWTTVDFVVVRLERDDELINKCQDKAKSFFLRVVLPELVAKHYTCKQIPSTSAGPSSEELPGIVTLQKTNQNAPAAKKQKTLSVISQNTPASKKQKTSCKATSKGKRLWCSCRRPEDIDDMVACDNPDCSFQWYHVSCVGLDQLPSSDETWFCSACLALAK